MRAHILFLSIICVSHSAMATTNLCSKPYQQIVFADTVAACTTLARAGNPNAQYHLGLLLFFGDGVLDNVKKSLSWLTKAANQGHIRAQRMLGLIYSRGLGVTKRLDLAKHWYAAAAREGSIEAEISLLKLQSREILNDVAATASELLLVRRDAWRSVFNTITAVSPLEDPMPLTALQQKDWKPSLTDSEVFAGSAGIP